MDVLSWEPPGEGKELTVVVWEDGLVVLGDVSRIDSDVVTSLSSRF